jgi:hypothetical protein
MKKADSPCALDFLLHTITDLDLRQSNSREQGKMGNLPYSKTSLDFGFSSACQCSCYTP